MLIQNIIQGLMGQPSQNVIRMMRSGLNEARGGNQLPHSTTNKTVNSLRAGTPITNGIIMTWDFTANDSALRVNNGGSKFNRQTTDVPYGSFTNPGGESQYITALITWCKRKYGLDDIMAKKMAFAVASSASNRGMVVKNPGWFNQIESSVYRQIIADLQGIMLININKQINKDLKGNK
jgi:hypothetical protein